MSSLEGFLVKQGYLVKTIFRVKQAFWSNRAEGFPGKTCQKGLLVDLLNALQSDLSTLPTIPDARLRHAETRKGRPLQGRTGQDSRALLGVVSSQDRQALRPELTRHVNSNLALPFALTLLAPSSAAPPRRTRALRRCFAARAARRRARPSPHAADLGQLDAHQEATAPPPSGAAGGPRLVSSNDAAGASRPANYRGSLPAR